MAGSSALRHRPSQDVDRPRVLLRPGTGAIKVNDWTFGFFPPKHWTWTQIRPLLEVRAHRNERCRSTSSRRLKAAAFVGHWPARCLGISRALVELTSNCARRRKSEGMLTRDLRAKERKKFTGMVESARASR